jgi:hypothetical protein
LAILEIGNEDEVSITSDDKKRTVTLGVDSKSNLLINGNQAIVRHPLELSGLQIGALWIAAIGGAVGIVSALLDLGLKITGLIT